MIRLNSLRHVGWALAQQIMFCAVSVGPRPNLQLLRFGMTWGVMIRLILILLASLSIPLHAATNDDNPCLGNNQLLNLVDRPTIGSTACIVPYKQALLESGYTHASLKGGGSRQDYPEAALRLGVVKDNEFIIILPDNINANIAPFTGFSATALATKHLVYFNKNLVFTVADILILPSGSKAYGSRDFGNIFDGILNYNITKALSLNLILGVSSETEPIFNGGGRYNSFNPDFIINWTYHKLVWYAEVYGQTSTGVGQGLGINAGSGFLYLFRKNIVLDIEVGQRLVGTLNDLHQSIGGGISILWG